GILAARTLPRFILQTNAFVLFDSFSQWKAQGFISGIGSFAYVASPLLFSPLTALFLSERAPFNFPGFSIMCVGFASMIAFVQSLIIRAFPPISSERVSNLH
ncbi:hypothetical protein ERO13_D08G184300v2, partial [Gossypium hirsutum]